MQHQSTFILGQKVIQFKPLFKDELLTEVKLLQYEYCGFLMMKKLLDCRREEIVNSGFWMASLVNGPIKKARMRSPSHTVTLEVLSPAVGHYPRSTSQSN